ncbi:MAG: glycoside hydrolase family 3 C-terminal domain-containing protein [Prevotella sp.]|nr:glycoside hydrolase family 3 C-terminal domain-containing protein [Prevotella sp.]MBR6445818.1 glycoside hydrolase family 3 C-terminal domain-containing protein [Prevotella sp.]MBR6494676.1 glycoside hydrolase family 3 C-terminal domain-containing protein [Prevotella sp.]
MALTAFAAKKKTAVLPYQNANLPIEERLRDLMSRMTLEEKIGQLRCTMAWNYYELKEEKGSEKGVKGKKKVPVPSESFKKDIAEGKIGMLWATFRADPWTQKSLENGLTPELAAMAANALQRYVKEHTRLGIPLFLAEETPHGHMAIGTTVFPTGLGMAATWSPEIIERVGKVIGKEIRLQGGHISYGPVLDISRDPRWSRVEESYGEDPVLTGELGAAMVRGLGGGDLAKPYSTLATLKHFIAYGTTEGGQNGNQTVLGPMELHQHFLPPFRKAIEAGALSVMTSYNSCDGIPCTSNEYLLTDVLHDQWGFRGFVVSDLFSIDGIAGMRVARNNLEAGIMALKAGVDADLGANAFGKIQELGSKEVKELSNDEFRVLEHEIDRACERILRLKFEMGLFENPYIDPKIAKTEVRTAENRKIALETALASITLLKNNGILPLKKASAQKSGMKILVVGPNADNPYNQLGDYTAPQADDNVTTVLEGLREKLSIVNQRSLAEGKRSSTKVKSNCQLSIEYVKGCAIRDTTESNIAEAVKAAENADVIIAVVGGSSARDFKTSYKETGAANTQTSSPNNQIPDMDCGEGFDRATLGLLGHQNRLLSELKNTGKPLVVVYIEGRPLDKTWAAVNADALLTAYYPGQEGGKAIADVLFGDYNPAGRLPISVPVDVGQLPVYYNKRAPRPHDYVEMSSKPLYTFGFGLSYTTFKYENLQIEVGNELKISCDVTNTGDFDGDEVVQLYVHDEIASVVQPLMQLKAFRRVTIPKGETRRIEFSLTKANLSIINARMEQVFESGDFLFMVGASSDDIRLQKIVNID